MTYPSWQTTRACIIVSIASLNVSAGTVLAASRSSIILRICMSRAAHPCVNAPPLAAAAPVIALRQSAASVHRANVFSMADLLDYLGCDRLCRRCGSGGGRREGPAAVVTIFGSGAAGGGAREHGADRRIRVRANVPAVHEHVVVGVGAVVLGRRQHGRGGANDQSKGNRGLRKHDFSLLVGSRAHRAGVCAHLGGRTARGKSRRGTNTSVVVTLTRCRKAPPNGGFLSARRMLRMVLRSRDWSTGAGSRA